MKKGVFILMGIVWLLLIYLAQIIAFALNILSNTKNKQKVFNDPSQLYIPPATKPIRTIIQLVSDKNGIFFILAGLVTILCIYLIIKQLFEKKDGNESNQDYKIAKHGSHGSARFAKDSELFDNGHYKRIRENDIVNYVYKSLNESRLKEKVGENE
ncbi:TPA: hypothetical protein P6O34_002656 [Staphylococcus aureus]|uniref:hypothetical protein n=1 Tax=Staphylococcus TaxID=1279 RepID=UPI0009836959|nr:hypothetical protein [Staphylococcus aureus]AQR26659.1 hypothetical protein AYM28_15295 [Staphylococcus aureus]AQR53178.1 hypothetical protein AYM37_15295 [Staphylococcus aureus]MBO8865150.1 hypothetical protein [Staphylococcus aureus]CAC9318656.1 Putative Transfer protein complex TraJ [Staphylococcus aureus]HCX0021381.1 hypothetical protein [Staphylococcus aureus]